MVDKSLLPDTLASDGWQSSWVIYKTKEWRKDFDANSSEILGVYDNDRIAYYTVLSLLEEMHDKATIADLGACKTIRMIELFFNRSYDSGKWHTLQEIEQYNTNKTRSMT